jgi:CRISPR-associated endonuclease/helicase Cas3
MMQAIRLPGLRAETLLGFLSALGTLRLITQTIPDAKLSWSASGGGWVAELHVPFGNFADAISVAKAVFERLGDSKNNHPILEWERFLTKSFTDESGFFKSSANKSSSEQSATGEAFTSVFSTQLPVMQGDTVEHFDHPFRAARKDYYLGNLKSVLKNAVLEHIVRTLVRPWDYRDAMANQSLRLDHGDDRRHAYQWHAPTEDPARQKSGCMLGANRLAIEAFPLFPCTTTPSGPTAVGFICKSKILTWINWPVWTSPCSLPVISSLLNLAIVHEEEPRISTLSLMGITAVLRSRRLPIEKNKVFLPPEAVGC